MKAITHTDFHFPGQDGKYVGKVRDVYTLDGKYILLVATDRISAFDVVLPKGIPCKGQVRPSSSPSIDFGTSGLGDTPMATTT